MKVLHISTYKTGGAGIAAFRLHKGLQALGVESEFLYLNSEAGEIMRKAAPAPPPPLPLYRRVWSKYLNKVLRPSNQSKESSKKEEVIDGNFEAFTSPVSIYDITLHPAYQSADIVNLHWVSDFLDYPTFFERNNKPLIWTLHDMNPFQGGFHYQGDALSNSHLADMDLKYLEIKQAALSSAKNIHIVALSKWILEISSKSTVFRSFSHSLIPNGIDPYLFKPLDKAFSRQVLGLPKDKKIVLFISEKLSVYRKGFDLLLKMVDSFKGHKNLVFCAVGTYNSEQQNNVVYLNAIQDERLIPIVYSACDVFVVPSREDNLPNVMLEALACGTPVVATPVGGIPDAIIQDYNGILAKDTSPESLSEALQLFFDRQGSWSEEKIREDFLSKYAADKQALAYLDLYQESLTSAKDLPAKHKSALV
ncbi:glycosyltransferase involved in cell wall biosynthesis [Pontibacter ummariensis]|uniref:Glycosyltransferase involved in cell wall bisynthesis n=1 Tax=Pontibacter ummariensis TaxID=1610492 RepID=A0A239BK83_9BACT|nr:glycosyltransferase [Pontibacter ummariensis]PRY15773.1 glycosyltransferase involved in cell wall biosynthesis [Pontibacter ummariensis]SNS08627.1 Glycosyltransferase involved in cell wall bisynthesis [Pontibacter ummariensis]